MVLGTWFSVAHGNESSGFGLNTWFQEKLEDEVIRENNTSMEKLEDEVTNGYGVVTMRHMKEKKLNGAKKLFACKRTYGCKT